MAGWQPPIEEVRSAGFVIDQILDVLWDATNHALMLRCLVRDPLGAEPTERIVLLPLRSIRSIAGAFDHFSQKIEDAVEQRRKN